MTVTIQTKKTHMSQSYLPVDELASHPQVCTLIFGIEELVYVILICF